VLAFITFITIKKTLLNLIVKYLLEMTHLNKIKTL